MMSHDIIDDIIENVIMMMSSCTLAEHPGLPFIPPRRLIGF